MKQLLTLILCCALTTNLFAQKDTTEVNVLKKNVVTVIEDDDKVQVVVGDGVEVITDDWGDTTHVRIGRRTFKVIEGNSGTYVRVEKDVNRQKWSGRFNPHWAGLEVGINIMTGSDYSIYDDNPEFADYDGDFLDLNPGKSLSWNLNFAEFAFKNERKTFGVVTGLGLSFNDYTFNDAVTIEKYNGDGMIVPVPLFPDNDGNNIKKSKLHVNYLTAPLMLEVKTPLRMGSSRLYLAGGVIGSLYLGSHTKYKYYKGDKEKSKSGYHINQWKYELTGRIGFGDFCVFANYSMTSLFKDGRGPEAYPLMIGVSFPNI
ncbi:outer membrane beta-barrel protein [Draconibacterium sp. IB214405]|uniref:outer membrane beta-barrel protein n=1 Tax=Draconibacterium sp. IB214405 TaxID=3097352 RepID=UPI002A17F82F|nr:outer membrane beta-barrel protein [Draconibacterium sp. IB214405]MDX8337839.1 outer membrane beta-barrel protein [Draconibacterium sp. IB214405]